MHVAFALAGREVAEPQQRRAARSRGAASVTCCGRHWKRLLRVARHSGNCSFFSLSTSRACRYARTAEASAPRNIKQRRERACERAPASVKIAHLRVWERVSIEPRSSSRLRCRGGEMADAEDSKSSVGNHMRVQVPPSAIPILEQTQAFLTKPPAHCRHASRLLRPLLALISGRLPLIQGGESISQPHLGETLARVEYLAASNHTRRERALAAYFGHLRDLRSEEFPEESRELFLKLRDPFRKKQFRTAEVPVVIVSDGLTCRRSLVRVHVRPPENPHTK
jgi:hypothetical protein